MPATTRGLGLQARRKYADHTVAGAGTAIPCSVMATPPASEAERAAMAGFVTGWLWQPGGFADDLATRDKALIKATTIIVSAAPMQQQLNAVNATGAGQHLLGLFTTPPAVIHLFANEILATGYAPQDVLEHELGHRLKFDHDRRAARMPVIHADGDPAPRCTGPHDISGHTMGAAFYDSVEDRAKTDRCPVCHIHDDTAVALMLLEGLREDAYLAAQPHELPDPWGGTIPLMRRRLACAQIDLGQVAGMEAMAGRGGEVREQAHLLNQAQHALTGILDPEAVSLAYPHLRKAWRAAATLNAGYWLRVTHPHDLAQSDLMLNEAFQPK